MPRLKACFRRQCSLFFAFAGYLIVMVLANISISIAVENIPEQESAGPTFSANQDTNLDVVLSSIPSTELPLWAATTGNALMVLSRGNSNTHRDDNSTSRGNGTNEKVIIARKGPQWNAVSAELGFRNGQFFENVSDNMGVSEAFLSNASIRGEDILNTFSIVSRDTRAMFLSPDGKQPFAVTVLAPSKDGKQPELRSIPMVFGTVSRLKVTSKSDQVLDFEVVCDLKELCDVTQVTQHENGFTKPNDSPIETIRVVSYNVGGGWESEQAAIWPDRLREVSSFLNLVKADIVALQEVRYFGGCNYATCRNSKHGLSHILGKHDDSQLDFPFYVYEAATINNVVSMGERVEEGLAVMSRYPIIDVRRWPLVRNISEDSNQRILLVATIKVPSVGLIHAAVTHLSFGDSARLAQSEQIKEIVKEYTENGPVILTGDLNAEPDDSTLVPLIEGEGVHDVWGQKKCGYTFPADWPRKRIDYILLNNLESNLQVTVTNVQCPLFESCLSMSEESDRTGGCACADSEGNQASVCPSDHVPVVADIRIARDT